jgi:hypothetical protein
MNEAAKIALITGAGRAIDIGYESTAQLAAQRMKATLTARDGAAAKFAIEEKSNRILSNAVCLDFTFTFEGAEKMGARMTTATNLAPRTRKSTRTVFGVAAVVAAVSLSMVNPAAAQSSKAAAIIIPDTTFDTVLDVGKKVATPCFEFTVPVKSRIRGIGCRVYAFVQGNKTSFDMPYATLEVLSDDPPGLNLEATAKLMLDALDGADLKRPYRDPKRAKYDTFEGKYLGANKAAINDMPAIFSRWGQESNPNVKEVEVGCPKKDFISENPSYAPYANVTTRMISYVPVGRFVWGGKPQRFFMAYGRIKACDGPYFNRVMATFTLL